MIKILSKVFLKKKKKNEKAHQKAHQNFQNLNEEKEEKEKEEKEEKEPSQEIQFAIILFNHLITLIQQQEEEEVAAEAEEEEALDLSILSLLAKYYDIYWFSHFWHDEIDDAIVFYSFKLMFMILSHDVTYYQLFMSYPVSYYMDTYGNLNHIGLAILYILLPSIQFDQILYFKQLLGLLFQLYHFTKQSMCLFIILKCFYSQIDHVSMFR